MGRYGLASLVELGLLGERVVAEVDRLDLGWDHAQNHAQPIIE